MASIPNLNTLGGGRRGHRLRGGRGTTPTHEDATADSVERGRDQVVQQTDHDASSSRMSAVALGYLDDPYARTFFGHDTEIPKRYPIINRGTYVRTKAIDRLVKQFLDVRPTQKKQIVSLGAGSDTRFFRLVDESSASNLHLVYHELDFEANVNRKRTTLRQSAELSRLLKSGGDRGLTYHLHALDLRDLAVKSPPEIPSLDPQLPTLLISECCLCYLPHETAAAVLDYFSMHIPGSMALVLYEPIRPFDAFGKTMVTNLASRGIHLQTLKRYSTLEAQQGRLRLAGLSDGQAARDVLQLYDDDDWMAPEERERIEKLEWLDEVEEWQLLASHYCVAWGWRGEAFGEAWASRGGSSSIRNIQMI
ncbi:hypothetical protein BAUCODRAFT_71209 [Baudoinia panamericana UAMH 10762]|uniref:Leucine carboxyl methyltransferase 1 n=1 Tax=Baudoinia panamericana (strain UAMH 10762) TaxID=717646 RepID=M2MGT6_BAUPA|nr:uncharacterized protein BAUCODRAFT_71209 [Baudoinia panamericana UAMH 10762]EMC95851.1 hypothetical protein BAUCODRAFT_71209 [Baudoinia panamericana UAMH 10762]